MLLRNDLRGHLQNWTYYLRVILHSFLLSTWADVSFIRLVNCNNWLLGWWPLVEPLEYVALKQILVLIAYILHWMLGRSRIDFLEVRGWLLHLLQLLVRRRTDLL